MEEIVALISELLDHLPDSSKWQNDETWKWCWDELSDEAQGKVALVRRKAVILLLEIEAHRKARWANERRRC